MQKLTAKCSARTSLKNRKPFFTPAYILQSGQSKGVRLDNLLSFLLISSNDTKQL